MSRAKTKIEGHYKHVPPCRHQQPLEVVGERLIGCIDCNRWGKPGDDTLPMSRSALQTLHIPIKAPVLPSAGAFICFESPVMGFLGAGQHAKEPPQAGGKRGLPRSGACAPNIKRKREKGRCRVRGVTESQPGKHLAAYLFGTKSRQPSVGFYRVKKKGLISSSRIAWLEAEGFEWEVAAESRSTIRDSR